MKHYQTDDPELEFTVSLLHEIEGIRLIEANYGHPEAPGMLDKHGTDITIGVLAETTEGIRFVESIVRRFPFEEYLTKTRTSRWVKVVVSLVVGWNTRIEQNLGNKADIFSTPRFTIAIHPNHNPTFDDKGIEEKLHGIGLFEAFLEDSIKKMRKGIDRLEE